MRLARLLLNGSARVGLVEPDGARIVPPGAIPAALRALPGLSDSLESAVDFASAHLLAPVLPGKVCAIGRNYAAHAAELGNDVPARPLLFHKPGTSIIGPGAPILLPPDSERVEHEVELAVVIGRRCRHVAPEAFAEVVAGYTILNDVTARDLQRRDGQFARGKGFDTFCPIGPWLETEFDPLDVAVSCSVDGVLRQHGRTSQMIFAVPVLVAAVSRIMTLMPGDIIATGTPQGVGPLTHGCRVECSIDGLGTLGNPVLRDEGVPAMPAPIA